MFNSYELGLELIELNRTIKYQEKIIDELRIKVAYYKASFFGKYDLAERLYKQDMENQDNLIGDFDGFCYASWRANAVYRTLEKMMADELITMEEYDFCKTR